MSLRGGHLYSMRMETHRFLLLIDCWLALLIRSMRMMETPGFLHLLEKWSRDWQVEQREVGTNMQLNLYRIINVGEKQRGMPWFRIHRFSCSV